MQRIIKAAIAALWFMLLTLPVLGIKLNVAAKSVVWRFDRLLALGAGIFVLALIWDWCFSRKAAGTKIINLPQWFNLGEMVEAFKNRAGLRLGGLAVLAVVLIVMPLVSSFYQTNIMISALLYVMLAFGILILILIFRPDGILGKATVQKV